MTARRKPDFDLLAALQDRGFTPRLRDLPELLEIVVEKSALSAAAERAVARVGPPGCAFILERARMAQPPARARLVALTGRLAAQNPSSALRAFLIEKLADTDEKTRRNAAIALGKIHRPDVASALASAIEREHDPLVRRSLVEALGKVGGPVALGALRAVVADGAHAGDQVHTKAVLIATRTLDREAPSAFAVAQDAPAPAAMTLRCRAGLESILMHELDTALSPELPCDAFGPGRVHVTLAGPPQRLFRARTLLSFGFPLPPSAMRQGDDIAPVLIDALSSADAQHIFRLWTQGPVRYRIAWAQGGKRRASVWRVAAEVARRRPGLINDPTRSTWEVVVHEAAGQVLIELSPRVTDPRFTYRRGDVPASSHPTLAAALVHVAGGLPHAPLRHAADEVVWDPFVGSATELCERALAGPFRLLIGSDRDTAALSIARKNLTAAGVERVKLFGGNALGFRPPTARPTLILTNPPMGRRLLRGADLGGFLERFLENAAAVLAPGGRLVWISPLPRRTALAAERLGLATTYRQEVDMGGFAAEIQAIGKNAAAVTPGGTAPNTRPLVR